MKGGVKEYWSQRVLRYHRNRRNDLNTRTLQALLRRNMKFYMPTTVLEIGCGPGLFTQILSKTARVVALDISKDMLKFVKNRHIKAEVLQADMDYLPFKPNSFDAIVAYRVMEYSKKPIRTLRAFSRLASTVLLQFPRHDSINGFLLLLYRTILTVFGPSPSFRSYSIKGALRLAKKAGFKIESIIPYNNGFDMQVVMQSRHVPKSYWDTIASEADSHESLQSRNFVSASKNRLVEYADTKARDLLMNLVGRHVALKENMKILDVGCGPGKWSIPFAKKCVSVTGIDLSEAMVQLAKKRAILNDLRNVRFDVMDAANLQFRDEIFDLVNCVTVLQHIFDDQKWKSAIHEMVRVTKTNRYIVIYETAPLFNLKKHTRYLSIRTMEEYISEFMKAGARLVSWRGTDLSYPLTISGLQKYATSFNEEEVYYYRGNMAKFRSFISKLVVTFAKPLDYYLAETPLGILSPIKIMLFQRGEYGKQVSKMKA